MNTLFMLTSSGKIVGWAFLVPLVISSAFFMFLATFFLCDNQQNTKPSLFSVVTVVLVFYSGVTFLAYKILFKLGVEMHTVMFLLVGISLFGGGIGAYFAWNDKRNSQISKNMKIKE